MVIKQYFRKIQGADILITHSVDVFPEYTSFMNIWENRKTVKSFVHIGSELILDQKKYFKIVDILEDTTEEIRNQPYFKLIPIGPTLEEYQRKYDQKSASPKQAEYPDFSFTVEALWFLYRHVEIIDGIIAGLEEYESIADLPREVDE